MPSAKDLPDVPGKPVPFWTWEMIVVVAMVLIAIFLLILPILQRPRGGGRLDQSVDRLKMLVLAALNYHDVHGHFPKPAYEPDRSWRAELLPFVEETAIFAAYDREHPWNAPENQTAVTARIHTYQSPRRQADPREGQPAFDAQSRASTNYFAVVGEGFIMNHQSATRLEDIRDGAANTILFVEILPSLIPWANPSDITFDEYFACVAGPHNEWTRNGILVVFADGKVKSLKAGITKEELRALFTIDGGEPPNPDIVREIWN